MIKLLIVDDSQITRELLKHIFEQDPDISVVGEAGDGDQALEMAKEKKPDVITMDINMPKMNGIDCTRKILETVPTPIAVVSGVYDPDKASLNFRVMEAGALAILRTPPGIGHPDFHSAASELVTTVKVISEVKVIKRYSKYQNKTEKSVKRATGIRPTKDKPQIIAIGASTGGPTVIQKILSGIRKDFPLPILIVQHMAPGFLQGLVGWLSYTSNLPVHIATHRQKILPGMVYLAPDEYQMGVDQNGYIKLISEQTLNRQIPSVSYLFDSVIKSYGSNAVGILLSGMGIDGAKELRQLKVLGATTIAQDIESSVVYGMPGEAIKLDGTTYVLTPEKISTALNAIIK